MQFFCYRIINVDYSVQYVLAKTLGFSGHLAIVRVSYLRFCPFYSHFVRNRQKFDKIYYTEAN